MWQTHETNISSADEQRSDGKADESEFPAVDQTNDLSRDDSGKSLNDSTEGNTGKPFNFAGLNDEYRLLASRSNSLSSVGFAYSIGKTRNEGAGLRVRDCRISH